MRPEDDTPSLADWQESAAGMDGTLSVAEDFFHTHARGVYTLVTRLLGDPADANDLTLEILLEAIEDPTVPSGQQTATRLREAAVRAVQSHRQAGRARHFRTPLKPQYLPALADHGAGQAKVEQALAALPTGHRDAFVLVDVESMPSDDVAALLGVGRAALKRRLHDARLIVRDALYQDRPSPSTQDRRKAHRAPSNLVAVVRLTGGSEATHAVVADRSTGGLALWLAGPLSVGSPLFVRQEPTCDTANWLRVEVRHCRQRESGGWAVGCRVLS